MGESYLVCFGISSKTLKNRNLKKIQNYKVSSESLFSLKNKLFWLHFFGKFRDILKIETIYFKKWENYI